MSVIRVLLVPLAAPLAWPLVVATMELCVVERQHQIRRQTRA
jgi:hypothetical protein